jgi:hypothetical protein
MMLAQAIEEVSPYWQAQEMFGELVETLGGEGSEGKTLSELEGLVRRGMEAISRELTETKLNEVGCREAEGAVIGADGVARRSKRLWSRQLMTSFGEVRYERWGYGAEGVESLFPADGHLNLALEKYTFEVRRLVSEDITKSSYEDTVEVLSERTGADVPKRQGLELVERASTDFEAFYAARSQAVEEKENAVVGDSASGRGTQLSLVVGGEEEREESVGESPSEKLLVLSTDGKGVVMRTSALREATKKAALREKHKLKKRLSRGEKRNRKRMAQVAAVYTVAPNVRTAEEVVGELKGTEEEEDVPRKRPRPENKRVWASVEREAKEVIQELILEAQSRDPKHERRWVALVDGNLTQLKLLRKYALSIGVSLTIVVDIIHVVEYLWKAAWALYGDGNPEAEAFVTERMLRLLRGESSQVAKGIRRMATVRGLTGERRKAVDKCAGYILKYKEYLRYDQYLALGFPIATGVIEGACRYLIKDRMDITGARWTLAGAEAVIQLRSLRSSGDFQAYWRFHQNREQERNHISRYAHGLPSLRQAGAPEDRATGQLRLVVSN